MIRATWDLCRDVGYQLELLAQVLLRLRAVFHRRGLIADQFFQSGLKIVHVVLFVGLFIGMIVALQTGIELARFGQEDQIGTIVSLSMCREMGPFITAIILAATVGSALAAELGTMSVNEELTALEVMSIDKVALLVMPRVIGLAVVCPVLAVLCDTIGILGGALISQSQLGVDTTMYFDTVVDALAPVGSLLGLPKDIYTGLLKAFVFGTAIGVISCAEGIQARGGAVGVGECTRRAVRNSIIATIIANYFLTWAFFG